MVLHLIGALAGAWYFGVFGVTTLEFATSFGFGEGLWLGLGSAVGLSTLYAAITSSLQVVVGGALALGISLFKRRLRLVLSTAAFLPYCLQPYIVAQIWRNPNLLGAGVEDFHDLVLASVWQFSPFAMIFFLIATETEEKQGFLVQTESSSLLGRLLQLNEVRYASLAVTLFSLRFLWMYTKFDLPYLFEPPVTEGNLLLVVEAYNRIGNPDAPSYLGTLVLTLSAILILGMVASKYISRIEQRSLRRQAVGRLAGQFSTLRGPDGRRQLLIAQFCALTALIVYLFPVLKSIYYLKARLIPSIVSGLKTPAMAEPMALTLIVCGSAAITAAVVGAVMSYAANRVDRGLIRKRLALVFPFISYAIPLVILAAYSGKIRIIIKELLLASPIPATWVTDASYGLAAFFIYFTFCLPFSFFVLLHYVGTNRKRNVERLRLADGLSPGIRFQVAVVLRRNALAIAYSAYFAFIICWQDIAVPRRLDLPLMASEFASLTEAASSFRPEEVTALGLVIGLILAFGYLVVAARAERSRE